MELPWNRKNLVDVWTWPHVFWLYIFGWWAEEAPTETYRKWLKRFRALSGVYLILLIGSLCTQICIKLVQEDILQNSLSIFTAGPGVVGIFKFFSIVFQRKLMKSIMDRLTDLIPEINSHHLNEVGRKSFKRVWIIFYMSLVFDCISVHWAIRPLIAALFYQEKTRIIDSWPVYIDTWNQWFFSYLYQFPSVLICGHSFFIYDSLFFCTSEVILCHLNILQLKLKGLVLNNDEAASKNLISCIKYHKNILSICSDFIDVTLEVIMWHFLNTVIMLCTGIFILIYMGRDMSPNMAMNLGEISLSVMIYLFFYCWYSNEITFQCKCVSDAFYFIDWLSAKSEDKKLMIIAMNQAMHPVLFGGLMQISLDTFINVLKATFSMFNFFMEVKKRSSEIQ